MKKILLLPLFVSTISMGSLFIMTDAEGNVEEAMVLNPTNNASLKQPASEYSLQALYDELNQAEYRARRASLAKSRIEQILEEKEDAEEVGAEFKLSPSQRAQLLEDAKYYKGGRYVWGGTTPKGFDCSGYVQYLYKKHNVKLPRTAWEQSKVGEDVDLDHLQKGDLLFFLTDRKRNIPITHVGIYIGGGEFIHAASKKQGVIISPITHGSYARTFVKAKRILDIEAPLAQFL